MFVNYIFENTAASPGTNELTHWPLGDFKEIFRKVIFQLILVIIAWNISYKIVLKWMPMDFTNGKSNIGSGNGLVLSGITWVNVDPDLCRHMASLGHNELKVKKCGNMADYHLHGEILEREVNIYILGHIQCHRHDTGRDHVFVPSQWEMPLHCNAVSHWLGAYTQRSLHRMIMLLSWDHILFIILYSVCLVRAWGPFQ